MAKEMGIFCQTLMEKGVMSLPVVLGDIINQRKHKMNEDTLFIFIMYNTLAKRCSFSSQPSMPQTDNN